MSSRLNPAEQGTWTYGADFPAVVALDVDGRSRVFRRARVRESRPGVLADYRENVARNSLHVSVLAGVDRGLADRSPHVWACNHRDSWNPDFGPWASFRHFIEDHPLGRILR